MALDRLWTSEPSVPHGAARRLGARPRWLYAFPDAGLVVVARGETGTAGDPPSIDLLDATGAVRGRWRYDAAAWPALTGQPRWVRDVDVVGDLVAVSLGDAHGVFELRRGAELSLAPRLVRATRSTETWLCAIHGRVVRHYRSTGRDAWLGLDGRAAEPIADAELAADWFERERARGLHYAAVLGDAAFVVLGDALWHLPAAQLDALAQPATALDFSNGRLVALARRVFPDPYDDGSLVEQILDLATGQRSRGAVRPPAGDAFEDPGIAPPPPGISTRSHPGMVTTVWRGSARLLVTRGTVVGVTASDPPVVVIRDRSRVALVRTGEQAPFAVVDEPGESVTPLLTQDELVLFGQPLMRAARRERAVRVDLRSGAVTRLVAPEALPGDAVDARVVGGGLIQLREARAGWTLCRWGADRGHAAALPGAPAGAPRRIATTPRVVFAVAGGQLCAFSTVDLAPIGAAEVGRAELVALAADADRAAVLHADDSVQLFAVR